MPRLAPMMRRVGIEEAHAVVSRTVAGRGCLVVRDSFRADVRFRLEAGAASPFGVGLLFEFSEALLGGTEFGEDLVRHCSGENGLSIDLQFGHPSSQSLDFVLVVHFALPHVRRASGRRQWDLLWKILSDAREKK